MNRESIYIFYSWQSDTDKKTNQYLIRDALKVAIEKLKKSINIAEDIILDQDTMNVPGIPQVTNTILEKIDRCSIFIPDITYISKAQSGKNIPNPNVLIELGYALKSLGSERIITVLNEAYGTCADGLPFDIGHRRWPVIYCLSSNSSSTDIKKEKIKLIDKFKTALSLIIEEGFIKSTKIDSFVRKIIAEIKDNLFLSEFSPVPKIEALNKLYTQLEEYALNGKQLDVITFLEFIKTKYLPNIINFIRSKDGENQNYLDYWNKIFAQNGSLQKIDKNHNKKQITDILTSFRNEMSFSEFVPVQSKEQYEIKFKKLSENAIDGNVEDVQNLKDFIKEYLFFLRAFTDGNINSEFYISRWNKVHDVLSIIEKKYKYI